MRPIMQPRSSPARLLSSATSIRPGPAGFTLLEMMISMMLFLIITGAIFGLLSVARAGRFTTNQRVDTMKNLHVSLNMMGRDALNAGFRYTGNGTVLPNGTLATQLDIPADPDGTRDILMAVMAGNNLNANTLTNEAGQTALTDQISFVYRDVLLNGGLGITVQLPNPAPTVNTAGAPYLTIAPPTGNPLPPAITNANFRDQDLLMIIGPTSNVLGVVTSRPTGTPNRLMFATGSANGDPLNINLPWATSLLRTMTPGSLVRVWWVSYSVLPDGTLIRTVYGNNAGTAASVSQPLAYNIEDMQIKYLMQDGDTLTDNPVAGTDGVAGTGDDNIPNLSNVAQMRVTVRARSAAIDPRTKKPVRISLTSNFSLRNLGYAGG